MLPDADEGPQARALQDMAEPVPEGPSGRAPVGAHQAALPPGSRRPSAQMAAATPDEVADGPGDARDGVQPPCLFSDLASI